MLQGHLQPKQFELMGMVICLVPIAEAVIHLAIQYLTVDSLRIQNTSNNVNAICILFSDASSFNQISRCLVEFSNLDSLALKSGAYIAFTESILKLEDSSNVNLGSFNTIYKNVLQTTNSESPGPSYGIVIKGNYDTYKTLAQNNTILENRILNFSMYGIFMLHTNGNQIEGNDISRLNVRHDKCGITMYVIYSEKAGASLRSNTILNNYIHHLNRDSSNLFERIQHLKGIYARQISGSEDLNFKVSNNTLRGLRVKNSLFSIGIFDCSYIIVQNNNFEDNDADPNYASLSYGVLCEYTKGSYLINGNTIQNCDGGKEWFGIVSADPAIGNKKREINHNRITFNFNSGINTYRIYCNGSRSLDSNETIEIKGNTIENSSEVVSTYGIYCLQGRINILDNSISINESIKGSIYHIYAYNQCDLDIARNRIVENSSLGNLHVAIYLWDNFNIRIASNLVHQYFQQSTVKSIFSNGGGNNNNTFEVRQNTILIAGGNSSTGNKDVYPLDLSMENYVSSKCIGNIIDVQRVTSMILRFKGKSDEVIEHNSYFIEDSIKQEYRTSSINIFFSNIDDWIASTQGEGEFNTMNSEGHHFLTLNLKVFCSATKTMFHLFLTIF
ncbi:MAG: hypothetical protein R2852_03950 [Bacteroidia bacterium]